MEFPSFLNKKEFLDWKYEVQENGKIRCQLTGHDLMPREEDVLRHLKGKCYRRERECYSADFSQFEPIIVESIKSSKRLFCTLCRIELNKDPNEVQKHLQGRKCQFRQNNPHLFRRTRKDEEHDDVEMSNDESAGNEQEEYFGLDDDFLLPRRDHMREDTQSPTLKRKMMDGQEGTSGNGRSKRMRDD